MSLLQRVLGRAFESARFLGPLRWDVALAIFRGLSVVLPKAAWVQRDLGRALTGMERWEEAEQACQQAVELTPTDAWAHYALAECRMAQKKWADALLSCETSLHLDGETPWFQHQYGKVLLGQEKFAAAIAPIQKAIDADDSVSWFHYHLGETQARLCHWSAAETALRRSLDLNPGFPWAKFYLGQALVGQDRLGDAIALYQTAQAEHPEMAENFAHNLAYAQHLQNQSDRITAYCQTRSQERSQRLEQATESSGNIQRPLDILLVTPYPTYPPKLGAITRMYQEARGLGKPHKLVVASFVFAPEDCGLIDDMSQYCDLPITVLLGDTPPRLPDQPKLVHKYSSERLTQVLQQLQAIPFDIVCFDFIYMAQYRHLFPNAFTVLGEHNIESSLLKRFADLKPKQSDVNKLMKEAAAVEAFADADREKQLLADYEDQQWPQFSLRTVVSELDKTELESRCTVPEGATWVVNNGIDTEATPLLENDGARKLFFFGTLTYFPNIDGARYFVETIMPLIWQEAPDLKLCIAGSNPPATVMELAEDSRIEIVANPETMEELAKDCSISVVPLRVGGGTRIKILHAMAMGLPVVSTSLGCEGLEGVDGEHLLIRDEPQAFAEAVLALEREAALRQRLRQAGRSLVETRYDWQAIYRDYEAKLFEAFKRAAV